MWCQMDLSRINNPNRCLTHSPWRSVKIQQLLQNNYFLNVYNTKRKKYLEVNAFDNLTINHNVRKYATKKNSFSYHLIRKHQREDWIYNNICVFVFVFMAILFSKSRYQREEWIGNHTCRLLQQNTNLFSQWNVNTDDYKFNSTQLKNHLLLPKFPRWLNARGLFGTFLLQNQLGTLQDCRFLFPGRLFKGKVIVHSFNLHLFLGKDEQLKSILKCQLWTSRYFNQVLGKQDIDI